MSTSNLSNQNGQIENEFTIRVPVEKFDNCVEDLLKESIYLDNKNISIEDVTEDYVDTEARAKAKKVVEQHYLEILKQAKQVKDVLEVESKLGEIREEIESKEGHLKYLNDRIKYSTVDLVIYQQTEVSKMSDQPFYKKLWNRFIKGFDFLLDFTLGFAFLIPLFIVLGVILYFVRKW